MGRLTAGMVSEYETPELLQSFVTRWEEGVKCLSSLGDVRKIRIRPEDRYLLIPVAKRRRFVYLWRKNNGRFRAVT